MGYIYIGSTLARHGYI